MANIYKAAPGSAISHEQAQVAGDVFESLRQQHGGLTANMVLDEARSESSPLHNMNFTWDQGEAAEKCRLEEARRLIRSVRVVIVRAADDKMPLEVRAFVSVTAERTRTYMPVIQVMSDAALRQQLLSRALLELQNFRKKYATLSELAVLFEAMDEVAAVNHA